MIRVTWMLRMFHKHYIKLRILPNKSIALGFTIVELMIALAIAGVLMMIAVPAFQDYGKRLEDDQAIKDLTILQLQIDDYQLTTGNYPNSLADIGMSGMEDPWGNTYEYLNYTSNPPGFRRKDRNLNPLNSDYDLYSKGEDGQTTKQIITPKAQDDIIRGRDGTFMGQAKDF